MGLEPPAIALSLRAAKQKKTRYDRAGFTSLPRIVALMGQGEANLLTLHKSERHGYASTITASERFQLGLSRFTLTAAGFNILPGRECIFLSKTQRGFTGAVESRELIDYPETAETNGLRADTQRINEALEAASLAFVSDGGPPVPTGLRALRRVFNLPADEVTPRFDLGGRLFGGWWLSLPRVCREGIRIGGEPIADLDFTSMFLRLAYAEVGQRPPEGDLYGGLQGLSDERWRPGVKKVASAMLFRRTPLTRLPRGTRELLPPGLDASAIRQALLKAHPALAGAFETGIGLRLMCTESRIMVAILLALADKGIAALPIHDGLMVARSKGRPAGTIMREAASAIVGCDLPISLKTQL